MARSPHRDSSVALSDDRRIAYGDFGPDDGRPLLFLHGNPGSRLDLDRTDLLASITAAGLRLIGFDRPGYGNSPFVPRRTYLDWAGDLSRIADHLGLESFALLAHSSGGLYGLAFAARSPERLTALCLLSPAAPGEMPVWLESWRPDVGAALDAFRRDPARARRALLRDARNIQTERDAVTVLSALLGSPVDERELRAHPEWYLRMVQEHNRQGPEARIEEARRMADWPLGFRLEEVEVSVAIWHGDADRLGPISHSRFLAERLPRAQIEELAGHGHLLTAEALSRIVEHLASTGR